MHQLQVAGEDVFDIAGERVADLIESAFAGDEPVAALTVSPKVFASRPYTGSWK